jgi:hypothetical protein
LIISTIPSFFAGESAVPAAEPEEELETHPDRARPTAPMTAAATITRRLLTRKVEFDIETSLWLMSAKAQSL